MWLYLQRLKILVRSKENLFWAIVFPLCLGTFFFFGFGNLMKENPISQIDVYIANDVANESFTEVIKDVKYSDDVNIFSVNQDYSQDVLETKLLSNEISDYIYFESTDDGLAIVYRLNEVGINQTVTKSFLDQYLQTTAVIMKVLADTPEKTDSVISSLLESKVYIQEIENERQTTTSAMIIYFYALIAMTCLSGSFWGIDIVNDAQANQTPLASRVSVAPTHKMKIIISNTLAAVTLHFSGCLLNFFYLNNILGIEFGDSTGFIILVLLVGTICGIALGSVLSSLLKVKANQKAGIISMITLGLSALSGLMVVEVKYLIAKNVPILGYINPASVLTDALYSLYYYADLSRFYFYFTILSVLSIVLLIATYFNLRGNRYDSV